LDLYSFELILLINNFYHEAFLIPGSIPLLANSLKHIRQIPKSLIYPLRLPQIEQRLTARVANFGFALDFLIDADLAIIIFL